MDQCCEPIGAARALIASCSARIKAEFFLPFWVPRSRMASAALGGVAGFLEDRSVRLAHDDTRSRGYPHMVQLWEQRVMLPAALTMVHPILGFRILSGEQKGSDVAMAEMEGRSWRMWPFFAIEADGDTELSKFWRRIGDGYYEPSETPYALIRKER
eukprot:TRINITY_DN15797_c0_g1_i4.p1 TRINITY_DN15797_c0_g1~~TRINITY_DN15797_c0_g1_i4.p1  ORF type:complete len:157 (-),score=25.32 TRINITY_DN15797_c0_g1_i4:295-765(-)